jgi:hypothetical protein
VQDTAANIMKLLPGHSIQLLSSCCQDRAVDNNTAASCQCRTQL